MKKNNVKKTVLSACLALVACFFAIPTQTLGKCRAEILKCLKDSKTITSAPPACPSMTLKWANGECPMTGELNDKNKCEPETLQKTNDTYHFDKVYATDGFTVKSCKQKAGNPVTAPVNVNCPKIVACPGGGGAE